MQPETTHVPCIRCQRLLIMDELVWEVTEFDEVTEQSTFLGYRCDPCEEEASNE